jgi:hypothetical protein
VRGYSKGKAGLVRPGPLPTSPVFRQRRGAAGAGAGVGAGGGCELRVALPEPISRLLSNATRADVVVTPPPTDAQVDRWDHPGYRWNGNQRFDV